MRLAQIVEQRKEKLLIPEAFRKMLGLYEGSGVFCLHLHRDQARNEPDRIILTTIPPPSWRTVLRISVLLKDEPGRLLSTVQLLADRNVNILLMEGYGYLPKGEGWWSAVIDFPSLHRKVPNEENSRQKVLSELREELRAEVQRLLERVATHYEGAKVCDSYTDEPSNFGGLALVTQDSRIVARIEPMRLQELADNVVDINGAIPKRIHQNTINMEVSSEKPRRTRHLMMCNTEERFIIMVGAQKGLAEIELKIHTEADNITGMKEGVGVFEIITRILKEFKALGKNKDVLSTGINIAFTYNYLMAHDSLYKNHQVETSVIKLYVESHPNISYLDEKEHRRIWKAVFRKLLEAKRENESPFVETRGSHMLIWQKKKRLIRSDAARQPIEVNILSRWANLFINPVKAKEARLFLLALLLSISAAALSKSSPFLDKLELVADVFAGAALVSLARILWPWPGHEA